jgi:hypothetical protein
VTSKIAKPPDIPVSRLDPGEPAARFEPDRALSLIGNLSSADRVTPGLLNRWRTSIRPKSNRTNITGSTSGAI